MTKLTLSDNLSLPLDFVTERVAFLPRTGAGKSGGMRVLFEQMFDAGQFCIFIDPKGDAWGIRAAGIGSGKPVLVMGGDHGDVPLEVTAGKVIAEFLVKERVSTVLDISDFGVAEMNRFVTDFASTLYRRNRDVLHLFIDEADMIAGEKYGDPKTLHALQLIQNKGRGRGFGVTVATQRSANINKTVLNASGTLVAMQTTAPNDVKAVKAWLEYAGTPEATKEILGALATLKTREAFIYSPQLLPDPVRIVFNEFQTFDSMRTPKPGETRQTPKSVADIDLSAVQRDMAETIETVKANDPRTLKAELSKVRGELAQALKAVPASTVEPVEVPIIPVAAIEALTAEIAGFRGEYIEKLDVIGKGFQALNGQGTLTQIEASVTKLLSGIKIPTFRPYAAAVAVKQPRPAASPTPVAFDGDTSLGKAERLVLRAFFWTRNDNQVTPAKIGFYSGYSHTSGGFKNTLSQLRTRGLLSGWTVTDEGASLAATYAEAKPSGAELREWLRPKIDKCSNEILDVLINHLGHRLSAEQIASQTQSQYSPTSGGFKNSMARLRSIEAAEGYAAEGVKAADVFFE